LVVEALQHGGNEGAAVERGRTHADERLHYDSCDLVLRITNNNKTGFIMIMIAIIFDSI